MFGFYGADFTQSTSMVKAPPASPTSSMQPSGGPRVVTPGSRGALVPVIQPKLSADAEAKQASDIVAKLAGRGPSTIAALSGTLSAYRATVSAANTAIAAANAGNLGRARTYVDAAKAKAKAAFDFARQTRASASSDGGRYIGAVTALQRAAALAEKMGGLLGSGGRGSLASKAVQQAQAALSIAEFSAKQGGKQTKTGSYPKGPGAGPKGPKFSQASGIPRIDLGVKPGTPPSGGGQVPPVDPGVGSQGDVTVETGVGSGSGSGGYDTSSYFDQGMSYSSGGAGGTSYDYFDPSYSSGFDTGGFDAGAYAYDAAQGQYDYFDQSADVVTDAGLALTGPDGQPLVDEDAVMAAPAAGFSLPSNWKLYAAGAAALLLLGGRR